MTLLFVFFFLCLQATKCMLGSRDRHSLHKTVPCARKQGAVRDEPLLLLPHWCFCLVAYPTKLSGMFLTNGGGAIGGLGSWNGSRLDGALTSTVVYVPRELTKYKLVDLGRALIVYFASYSLQQGIHHPRVLLRFIMVHWLGALLSATTEAFTTKTFAFDRKARPRNYPRQDGQWKVSYSSQT